ncbi:FecR domain-containing protein [Mucilaginibacter sp. UR6-1]|uniref:FecR family protein n=1 Tax=Mucilaginibacter sp. UR6-1 TaxID=1435643 RepID=UPI001E52C1D2|nr:FecR family protein [Mucilaginibacter sp. UR6-1]MCC8411264.1 FecR domain-containing protein [Mucilaginibacter sp. UR6-1]
MSVPEKIKVLVFKWRKGTLTPEERKELDAWYVAALPEEIDFADDITEDDYRQQLLGRIHNSIGAGSAQTVRMIPAWLRVAAVLLVFCGVSLLIYRYLDVKKNDMPLQSIHTQNLTVKRIVLPDSSIVWLKGNSNLSFPDKFDKLTRQVELHGEALFEVSHHEHWPFKIRSGNFVTTVLGTSFNINTGIKDDDYNISVLTGRVQVVQKKADKQDGVFYINANQVFQAAAGKVETVPAVEKQAQRVLLTKGTTYDMDFEKIPFETIMHQFSAKFDMEFEGYTGEYKACSITADLTGLPMEKALKILCLSINATYKIHGNKIKLTGGGCF